MGQKENIKMADKNPIVAIIALNGNGSILQLKGRNSIDKMKTQLYSMFYV